jgi:cold shock CspA family protein
MTTGADAAPVAPGPIRPGRMGRLQTGTVDQFDEAAGLGAVATTDGDRFLFHCTAITDGSRSIEVGTAVAFVVEAGGPGWWEARSVRPVS